MRARTHSPPLIDLQYTGIRLLRTAGPAVLRNRNSRLLCVRVDIWERRRGYSEVIFVDCSHLGFFISLLCLYFHIDILLYLCCHCSCFPPLSSIIFHNSHFLPSFSLSLHHFSAYSHPGCYWPALGKRTKHSAMPPSLIHSSSPHSNSTVFLLLPLSLPSLFGGVSINIWRRRAAQWQQEFSHSPEPPPPTLSLSVCRSRSQIAQWGDVSSWRWNKLREGRGITSFIRETMAASHFAACLYSSSFNGNIWAPAVG